MMLMTRSRYTWMFEVSRATVDGPPTPAVDHWTIHQHTNAAWGLGERRNSQRSPRRSAAKQRPALI
jgi:hypothetical protein